MTAADTIQPRLVGHLVAAAGRGEEQEPGEPEGDGRGADPLPDGDGEVGSTSRRMATRNSSSMVRIGWTTDRLPEVQRERLQQEGADHEAEAQQPHPAPEAWAIRLSRMVDVLGGVLDPHALEHAGQRIGQCRSRPQGHRPSPCGEFYGRAVPASLQALGWR